MGKAIGIIVLLAAVLGVILFLPTSTQAPGPAKPGNTGGEFSVALVTPGAVSGEGWSPSAYQGLKKIEAELGAKVSNTVAKDGAASEAFAAFRDFADRDTNLIIGHAGEWFD